nr:MAG TPA: Terminase large subunit [Caudoviricetes sp.]
MTNARWETLTTVPAKQKKAPLTAATIARNTMQQGTQSTPGAWHPTATMSVQQLQAEAHALMQYLQEADTLPPCTRPRCAGYPHDIITWRHDPKLHAAETPLAEMKLLDPDTRERPHITYLSERLHQAILDVENGQNRHLTISMPPRSGKTWTTSQGFPSWVLHRHPDWKIGLVSHSPELATSWGRDIRRRIEEHGEKAPHEQQLFPFGVAPDAGAVSHWETTEGGSVTAKSAPGQSLTGRGFKVLIADDVVKDYAAAHSEDARNALWEWWQQNTLTRLEPPYLLIVVGTRWHEDDLIGRIKSPETNPRTDEWEHIIFPAFSTAAPGETDEIGRKQGEPLTSPLMEQVETTHAANKRWSAIRERVGSMAWEAQYMQRPAADTGGIIPIDKLKFFTTSESVYSNLPTSEREKVTLLTPTQWQAITTPSQGIWVDSWDTSFKGGENSDYTAGQRWVKHMGTGHRFLIASFRRRCTYIEARDAMRLWAGQLPPLEATAIESALSVTTPHYSDRVLTRLIEETANGPALITSLQKEVEGIKPVNPKMSKEARARVVTPEMEAGLVYLPHPQDPTLGGDWVNEMLKEWVSFPHAKHDDTVDAMTQALAHLKDAVPGSIHSPNETGARIPRMAPSMYRLRR